MLLRRNSANAPKVYGTQFYFVEEPPGILLLTVQG